MLFLRVSSGDVEAFHDNEQHGGMGDVSGVQEIDGIGGQVSTANVADAGYVKTSPAAVSVSR